MKRPLPIKTRERLSRKAEREAEARRSWYAKVRSQVAYQRMKDAVTRALAVGRAAR